MMKLQARQRVSPKIIRNRGRLPPQISMSWQEFFKVDIFDKKKEICGYNYVLLILIDLNLPPKEEHDYWPPVTYTDI